MRFMIFGTIVAAIKGSVHSMFIGTRMKPYTYHYEALYWIKVWNLLRIRLLLLRRRLVGTLYCIHFLHTMKCKTVSFFEDNAHTFAPLWISDRVVNKAFVLADLMMSVGSSLSRKRRDKMSSRLAGRYIRGWGVGILKCLSGSSSSFSFLSILTVALDFFSWRGLKTKLLMGRWW